MMKKLFMVFLTCLFCTPLFGVTFGFTNRDNGFVLPVSASFTMQMYQASAVTTIADGDNNVLFTLTDAGTTGNANFTGTLQTTGIGVGTAPVTTAAIRATLTPTADASARGLFVNLYPNATATSKTFYGGYFGNTPSGGTYTSCIFNGVSTWVGGGSATVTMPEVNAIYGGFDNTNANQTVTTAFLLRGNILTDVSPGTVTNLYGLYVPSITAGASTNYAIYTNGGAVRFGDDTTMIGDLAVDGGDITSSATTLILNPSGNGALTIADTYCNISNTTGAVSAVAVQAGTTGGATKFLGQLKNDAGTTKHYGGIEIKSPTITAGAEVGRIDIDLMGGATPGTMEYAAIRLQSTCLSTTKPLRVDGGYIGLTADTDLIALAANTVTVAGSIVVGASATVAGDVTHHHGGASYFYVPSSATNYFKVSSTSPGGNERLVITDATDEWVFDKANNTFASPGPIYCVGRWYSTSYAAFTANDTTPAVNGGNYFSVPDTWTAGNNITGFDNAVGCQLLVIVGGDSDCVVVDGGHLLLNGNWTAAAGATLTLLYDGSDFRELSRSTS
jgi:hypothetical protein